MKVCECLIWNHFGHFQDWLFWLILTLNLRVAVKQRKIPTELMRLFAHLQLEDKESISTQDLTQSFGWQSNQLGQQHDVAELNRILIDAIGRSLKGTSAANLVSDLYRFVGHAL